MTYCLGRFRIRRYVETGIYEGETIRYFSWFVPQATGCDINSVAVEIGRARLKADGRTNVTFHACDSESFLSGLQGEGPLFFYLDSNWTLTWPVMKELEIIRKRWANQYVAVVNNVRISNNPDFGGREDSSDAQFECLKSDYTQILVPSYTIHEPYTGYVVLNAFPDKISYPAIEYVDLCPWSRRA
jgi:hypothetical protein